MRSPGTGTENPWDTGDGDPWPAEKAGLRYRRTDLWIREETGIVPLSVSTDRIGVPALRIARALAIEDKAGNGTVVEVYPAAAFYVAKAVDLDDVPVQLPDGTTRVAHIAACGGAASLKELTETGEPHYEPLSCGRLQRHEDKAAYRWHGYYRLPEEYGGRVISVRHHQNADDDRRELNRTENLRPIPEGSKDFARLHVLRRDAESINRGVEDSLFINRATAKGWRRQMVDLLGHARLVNAITLARCRARERLVPAA